MIIQFKHLLRQILPCLAIGLLFLAGCALNNNTNNPNNTPSVQEAHKPEKPTKDFIHETPHQPEYIDGNTALPKFIAENLHYPEGDSVEGTVAVKFTVTPQGEIIEPAIIRGLSPAIDKEALRIVRLFKYKPFNKYMGTEPIIVKIPIKFRRKRN